MPSYITRTVLILSLVSLFADISSEMLYPVMPLYLEQIGFGALAIGLLEGLAQFIAGLGKAWFGSLSDQLDRRNIFIRSGYFLSALGKPLMGILPQAALVFTGRSVDRLGKGLRSAARDALLVKESAPENRGKVFGFHRAMDTLGAVIGPAITLLLIYLFPGEYAWLFLLAFVPGLISVLITLFLPKESPQPKIQGKPQPFKGIFKFWKSSSGNYRRLLLGFLLFTLLNSSDLFLILRGKEIGLSDYHLVGAYILYNLVYAVISLPAGSLSDRFGFKPVYLASILIFGGVYVGFSLEPDTVWLYALFAVYGLFAAANESMGKAWISHFIPAESRATGLGLYQFLGTFVKLVASPLTGILWILTDGHTAFLVLGLSASALFLVLFLLLPGVRSQTE